MVGRSASFLSVIHVTELDPSSVLKLAIEKSITFYDAAYVVAAKERGLDLITDDEKLKRASREYRVSK